MKTDRKWKLTKFNLAAGTLCLLVSFASHLQGADNTTLIIGVLAFMAGITAEYFAANVTINKQKSEHYQEGIRNEK